MTKPLFKYGLAGKAYTNPAAHDVQALVGPATKVVALPTDGTTFDPPRMILANVAGTATVTDASGQPVANFPLTGGEQHVAVIAISNLATTTRVFGLY